MSVRTHGMSKSPIRNLWNSMVQRCTNPNVEAFKDYGGRGITVDPRWLVFENFYADMGERPDGRSLERRDNEKGYGPENCYWATALEQANNTRVNRRLVHDGKALTLAQWGRETGFGIKRIHARLKRGWSVSDALTKIPTRSREGINRK